MKFNMKIQFVGLTVGQVVWTASLIMKFNMKIQFVGLTVGQLACA